MLLYLINVFALAYLFCREFKKPLINKLVSITIFASFSGFVFSFGDLTLNRCLIVLYLLSLLMYFLSSKNRKVTNASYRYGLSFVFFMAIYSILFIIKGVSHSESTRDLLSLFSQLGYVIVAVSIWVQRHRIDYATIDRAFVVGGIMLSIVCVVQYVDPSLLFTSAQLVSVHHESLHRVVGLHGNPNACGFYLGFSGIILLNKILTSEIKGIIYLFLCGFVLFALLLTYSRSAIGAVILCSVLVCFLYLKSNPSFKKILIPLFLGMVVVFSCLLFLQQRDFFGSSESDSQRFFLWSYTFNNFKSDFLFGVWEKPINVHNGFLEVLFFQGVVGFVFYFLSNMIPILYAIKNMNHYNGILLILIMNVYFNNSFHSIGINSIIMWMLLSLLFIGPVERFNLNRNHMWGRHLQSTKRGVLPSSVSHK